MGAEMKKLIKYIKLYFLLFAQYAKSLMSFKVDFFISLIGMFMWWVPSFISILIIFYNIPSLSSYSYYELMYMYGFFLLAMEPSALFFNNVWRIDTAVRYGDFIKYYLKPINMLFYFMSESIDLQSLWTIPAGIGIIVWTSIKLNIQWTAIKILITILLLFSSSLIICSFMLTTACTAFWITNAHSLLEIVSSFRENSRYPITIYSKGLRILFSTLIPIGFVCFYPTQWILQLDGFGIIPYLTPFVGIFFFSISLFVWKKGVLKWTGTGT